MRSFIFSKENKPVFYVAHVKEQVDDIRNREHAISLFQQAILEKAIPNAEGYEVLPFTDRDRLRTQAAQLINAVKFQSTSGSDEQISVYEDR
jgi:hypothetical protein